MGRLISDKYREWEAECRERFDRLKGTESDFYRYIRFAGRAYT